MKKETKKEHKKFEDEKTEIDFDIGKLGLGGLFKGIEKLVDLAERVEQAGGEIKKSGTIKGLGGRDGVQGVYGFTIRTGLGQKTRVEPFGNISAKGGSASGGKKTKAGLRVSETREPLIDVFDEKNHVLVIVELPGVDEKSIKLELKKDILLLEAESKGRKYIKEILLPAQIDLESREMSFKNGLLELKFKKI